MNNISGFDSLVSLMELGESLIDMGKCINNMREDDTYCKKTLDILEKHYYRVFNLYSEYREGQNNVRFT